MRIHYLQHVPFEWPGNIAAWAQSRGHELAGTRLFTDTPLPDPSQFDWLIVMGGPMSVHDEHQFPWLVAEKRLIERCLAEDKPVLGVCLGAQLMAQVLGARVYRNAHPEIGWFPVRRTAAARRSRLFTPVPTEFIALHWHGETFDLPRGAIHLAESDACLHQAFEFNSSLALQFHLELHAGDVQQLIHHCGHELGSGPWQQSADALPASEHFAATKEILFELLDHVSCRYRSGCGPLS